MSDRSKRGSFGRRLSGLGALLGFFAVAVAVASCASSEDEPTPGDDIDSSSPIPAVDAAIERDTQVKRTASPPRPRCRQGGLLFGLTCVRAVGLVGRAASGSRQTALQGEVPQKEQTAGADRR